MRFILGLAAKCILTFLKLRYRIEIKNGALLEELKRQKGKGILFLPNHPAEVDPIIMTTLLYSKFQPRPLVVDHFYFLSGAGFFMRLVRAVPIPNFETAINRWKEKRGDKALMEIKEGLGQGENFLIYPSGHLRRSPKERIGGSSLVHTIAMEAPDTRIVLVRFTGLWGSMFSRAITGHAPDFWKGLADGIKIIFKNGIFFVPKRDVTIEFYAPESELPKGGNKLEFNRFLEKWYNQFDGSEEEPLKLVSYSSSKEELPVVTFKPRSQREDLPAVSPKIREQVLEKLSEVAKRPASEIREEMDLSMDLGLDSLDIAGMLAFLDHKYQVEGNHPGDLQKVSDLFYAAMGEKLSDDDEIEGDPNLHWAEELDRPPVTLPMGATIQESFLRICDRMGEHEACADARMGILTYKRLKKGALVLAEHIKKLPGERIGVMLPASSAVYLLLQAVLLAKKTPVMLNWTTGARTLNYAAQLTDLQVVLSSRTFLERADGVDLGDLDDKLLLLEDMKGQLSLSTKLKGLFKSFLSADMLLKTERLKEISSHSCAVMLFTSGTENYPKAVPLTHYNILSNQRAGISCIDLNREDIMLGVLPPFHSFGFTVTGLLPLLSGFRAFYSPNPTDSEAIAKQIAQWKITYCCLAPSFYKNLFRVAKPEELQSVRYFVSGAEKAPQDLYDTVKSLGGNKQLVEGYGITECSPIVTISRPGKPAIGVGQPLPGLELCTISPDTQERLPKGQSGEICMKGPSIFGGYFGKDVPNPFIELDGELWYRSGDMGRLDETNHVIFEGRLKRFVKVGGEMVSLTAIEDELIHFAKERGLYDPEHDKHPLAISAIEREDERPDLILIAIFDASKEDLNQYLRDKGFGRIVKIAKVHKVMEIPLTGTGKIHFKALNDLVKNIAYA